MSSVAETSEEGGERVRSQRLSPRASSEQLLHTLAGTNPTYKLLILGRLLDRVISRQVKSLADMPLAEWKVMAMLGMLKEGTASEIAATSLSDPAEVSRAVNALEAKGMVQRGENPRNRRSALVSLTRGGQVRWRETAAQRAQLTRLIVEVLSAEERDALDDMLTRLAGAIMAAEEDIG